VLITEAVARRETAPVYLARGQQHKFLSLIAAEEEEWDEKVPGEKGEEKGAEGAVAGGTFEEYREKSKAAGVM